MSYALFSITEQQSVGPESTERDTRLSVTSLLDHCKRRNTKQTATSRKWKVGGGQKEKGHRPDLLDVECVNLLSSTLSQVIVCVCMCVRSGRSVGRKEEKKRGGLHTSPAPNKKRPSEQQNSIFHLPSASNFFPFLLLLLLLLLLPVIGHFVCMTTTTTKTTTGFFSTLAKILSPSQTEPKFRMTYSK